MDKTAQGVLIMLAAYAVWRYFNMLYTFLCQKYREYRNHDDI